MLAPVLPHGAKRIWDMRMQGIAPGEVVFVSLIGPLNAGNFNVEVQPGTVFERMDWRWTMGLGVCLVYSDQTDPKAASRLAKTLVRCAPCGSYARFSEQHGHLWVWNASKQGGVLMSWWAGHAGIPLLGVDAQKEEIEICPMSRLDRRSFEGVTAA